MRKVVLYIAMSLDGYIADRSGGVGWLEEQDQENGEEGSYPEFIKTVDTVILGYTTYHQIATQLSPQAWPYAGMQSYVLTHHECEEQADIHFVSESLPELIRRLRAQDGKDIWVCGGADLVNQLLAADEIDRYCITMIPVLLGGGIRLFEEGDYRINLRFLSTRSYNGMTDLVYERRG